MDLLEDPVIKTKYLKSKLRVKSWESDFIEKYGRRPNKNDIKEADVLIKDAYKIYWNLKTTVLEQTLTDVTFSDETEINNPPNESKENSAIINNVSKDMENIDPCSNTQIVESSTSHKKNTLDGPNVDGAWGIHLNTEQCSSTKRKTLLIGRSSSSFQLSQNKFTSENFIKRNPRKSLSLNKIKSKSNLNDSTCVKNLSQDKSDLDQSRDGFDIDEETRSVFDKSSLKIICHEPKPIVQPLYTIQQLLEGQSSGMKRNINMGWLERCSNTNPSPQVCHNSESLSGKSDSGRESMESVSHSPINVDVNPGFHSSDEDFIYDSDDSTKHSRKRIRDEKTDLCNKNAPPLKRFCIDNSSQIDDPTNNIEPANIQDKQYSLIPDENKDVIVEVEEPIIRAKKSRKSNQAHLYNEHLDSDSYSEKNSDLDSDYEEKRVKSKSRVMRKTKKNPQKKRTTRRKSCENKEEEKEPDIPIYGVETIETVPRFSISTITSGDLIADFSKTINIPESSTDKTKIKTKDKLTDKEKLEAKVKSGKLNENFVRINLKKKIYVRGKKSFNFSKYKKNQWKERKKELESSENNLYVADMMDKSGGIKCFKCGNMGHFARNCTIIVNEELLKLDEIDDGEESRYPTLEEAERMAMESTMKMNENIPGESVVRGHEVPKDIVAKLLPLRMKTVDPIYSNPHPTETPLEVFEALKMFGHENFRPGQEKAILRILSGQSTLVTLATGSGKSLCYQLPAYLYSKRSLCITLVISPLVSLMNDQVTGVPSFLTAGTLHTNQTPKVQENVMQMIKEGTLSILLLSPEAIVAGEKSTGFGALLRQLPPIAFACIDEAHCISQWSHNFRPSYLMLSRVLKEKLGVKTILGLTATAKKSTAESIVKHLAIPDGLSGVISDTPIPDNLFLSVSKDENKDHALIKLLNSERFCNCNSIIVYCIRREECVRIAGVLRTSLRNSNESESTNSKVSSIAEAYHAGLSAYRRKIVQNSFMKGLTKIVVATVAFGMGINKPDIRSVIHYNMPGSFEGYVQEVGRAGRDGLLAQCHLFLNFKENSDKWELRRHIFANGVDRYTIRRLLEKVFIPCSCKTTMKENTTERCPGHEVAIPIDETVSQLDVSEETITTLLCYLELHPKRFITVLSSVYVRAKVSSYNGPQTLKLAAQSSPPLAMAIALNLKKGISHENSTVVEFPVVDIASAIGWDSGVVKSHLKSLEWKKVNGKPKRSAISVHYDTLGLRVRAPGDLTEAELDEALDELVACTQSQETSSLQQLEIISEALNKSSVLNIKNCLTIDEDGTKKSELLKNTIRNYFTSDHQNGDIEIKLKSNPENEKRIAVDIRSMISIYKDNNLTGRAIARIFHGIQSPNYPAVMWSKCRFWRSHLDTDFNTICQIATKEILGFH